MVKNDKGIFLAITALILSLLASPIVAATLDTAVKVKWGYKGSLGPANWGQLDKSFLLCLSGKQQSPINIPIQAPLATASLSFNYQAAPMILAEDSQTMLKYQKDQLIINDGHTIQVNFPPQKIPEQVILEGKTYHLIQFHVHSPSENELAGNAYPLEIHFVHQADDESILAIGVFVQGGKSNPTLASIIKNIPPAKKQVTVKNQTVNPVNLLPQNRAFYLFAGSLTTPPCIEGLTWVVLKNPITASPGEILSLRKAANGGNARPIQATNGRKIEYVN